LGNHQKYGLSASLIGVSSNRTTLLDEIGKKVSTNDRVRDVGFIFFLTACLKPARPLFQGFEEDADGAGCSTSKARWPSGTVREGVTSSRGGREFS
jgi:hypothetical protein